MEQVDRHNLGRFVEAQAANYHEALAEIRAGRKETHWSWYVLPQVRGLGSSPMSQRYAIAGLEEARDYLAHPVLGPRLRECVTALNNLTGKSAADVLGDIDAQKFRACVTLFARVAEQGSPFVVALARHFGGREHTATRAILSGGA